MIVRGDRLAESERVNRLRLADAGLWALLLASPRAVDDFGIVRWEPAHIVTALFPRRSPAPLRAVRSFMEAVEEVGLVATYEADGVTFAEIRAWSGVEPAKRRWHRSPLPSWKKHECVAACRKSYERVALAWHQGFSPEKPRADAPDADPDADPDVDAPFGSSVPPVPPVPSVPSVPPVPPVLSGSAGNGAGDQGSGEEEALNTEPRGGTEPEPQLGVESSTEVAERAAAPNTPPNSPPNTCSESSSTESTPEAAAATPLALCPCGDPVDVPGDTYCCEGCASHFTTVVEFAGWRR